MKNNILIITAHPDDELLWVWWTILRHKNNWDEVNILVLSNWEDSRWEGADSNKRITQANLVSKKLWINSLYIDNLPDNGFDSVPLLNIAQVIEKYTYDIKPNIIYTHHANDLNIDHQLTFQAVLTACRPQPWFCVKKILTFETLSSTEWQTKTSENIFKPNYYVDIEQYIDEKIEIMKIYKDELKKYPHPRSIEWIRILAQYRGLEVGLKYAEAFEIIRQINC